MCLCRLDRGLWLFLLLVALALSGFMIWKTLSDWQARQVVTTLNTLTKSVEGKMDIPRDVVMYCADLSWDQYNHNHVENSVTTRRKQRKRQIWV